MLLTTGSYSLSATPPPPQNPLPMPERAGSSEAPYLAPSESNTRACARDVSRVGRSRGESRVVAVVAAAVTIAPSLTAAGGGNGRAPPARVRQRRRLGDNRGKCRVRAHAGASGVRAARA